MSKGPPYTRGLGFDQTLQNHTRNTCQPSPAPPVMKINLPKKVTKYDDLVYYPLTVHQKCVFYTFYKNTLLNKLLPLHQNHQLYFEKCHTKRFKST